MIIGRENLTASMISVATGDDRKMPAYLASPAHANGAAVVVLQEIFGVNANIRAVCDDYAARGCTAIAPDLFWRIETGVDLDPADPASRETAMALMQRLDQAQAVKDALAAARHVAALTDRRGGVAAVGYCLGGKLAFLLSMEPGIDAAVAYYGTGIHPILDQADRVRAPVLLHVAMEDNLCPPEAQAALHARFDGSATVSIMDHPGVGHAFARRGAPTCVADAADRADAATAAFLSSHLARG